VLRGPAPPPPPPRPPPPPPAPQETFERPIYAGNAVARVRVEAPGAPLPALLTVRALAFPPAALRGGAGAAVEAVPGEVAAAAAAEAGSKRAGETIAAADAGPGAGEVDLGAARVVVAGGRGLGSKEVRGRGGWPRAAAGARERVTAPPPGRRTGP